MTLRSLISDLMTCEDLDLDAEVTLLVKGQEFHPALLTKADLDPNDPASDNLQEDVLYITEEAF